MMYKRVPTQIAVAAFPDPPAADTAAEELGMHLMDECIVCTNLAVVSKSANSSKVKIKEHGKHGPLNGFLEGGAGGTVAGGFIGGLALSLLGRIGSVVGATAGGLVGAAVGAVQGTIVGTVNGLTVESMDKENLMTLGDCLEPGSSVLIVFFGEVVVKKSEFHKAYREIEDGTESFVDKTAKNIKTALKQKKIFGMTVSIDEDGVTATQTTLTNKAVNLVALLMTPDGETIVEAAVNEGGDRAIAGLHVNKEEGVFGRGNILTILKEDAVIYEV